MSKKPRNEEDTTKSEGAELSLEEQDIALEAETQAGLLQLELAKTNAFYSFNYGIDLANSAITLGDGIDDGGFEWFDSAISQLESQGVDRITLRLYSHGGVADESMAMLGRIHSAKRVNDEGETVQIPVDVECYGCAMSAATLLLACTTGERRMSQFADFMWHEAHSGVIDRASYIHDTSEEMKHLENKLCGMMGKYTKKPKKFWQDLWQSRKDHFFTPEECKKLGVIDKIF